MRRVRRPQDSNGFVDAEPSVVDATEHFDQPERLRCRISRWRAFLALGRVAHGTPPSGEFWRGFPWPVLLQIRRAGVSPNPSLPPIVPQPIPVFPRSRANAATPPRGHRRAPRGIGTPSPPRTTPRAPP